jgi:hypothetical protein
VTLINDELSGNRFTSLLPKGEEFLAETKVMQNSNNFLSNAKCMYVCMYVCMGIINTILSFPQRFSSSLAEKIKALEDIEEKIKREFLIKSGSGSSSEVGPLFLCMYVCMYV